MSCALKYLTTAMVVLCTGGAALAARMPDKAVDELGLEVMMSPAGYVWTRDNPGIVNVHLYSTDKGFWIVGASDYFHRECQTPLDDRLAHRLIATWRQASPALDAGNYSEPDNPDPMSIKFTGYDMAAAKAFHRPDPEKYDSVAAESAQKMMRALLRYCQKPGSTRHEDVERHLLDLQNDIRPPGFGFVPHKDP